MKTTANNKNVTTVKNNAIKRRSTLSRLRQRGGLNSFRYGVSGLGISFDIN